MAEACDPGLNEMHICEELVFNKHTGALVGFASLGDVTDHLKRSLETSEINQACPPLTK